MDIRPPHARPSRSQLYRNFSLTADAHGFRSRPASPQEKKEDVDFVIWRLKNRVPVDIAAVSIKKTILRKSKKRKQLWAWVEFHDKDGGLGWLFKKSTFIAFQRKNDFILLVKSDFRDWLDTGIIHWGKLARSSWDARYRIFRRKGTKESIAQFKLTDALSKCRHYKWDLHEGSA